MSIVEYRGGPITHRYLMKKTRAELERMYLSNQKAHGFINGLLDAKDLRAFDRKDQVASEVMAQFRRMPADE